MVKHHTQDGSLDLPLIAVPNRYGRGEALWVPSNLGLGARVGGNSPLTALLTRRLPGVSNGSCQRRFH